MNIDTFRVLQELGKKGDLKDTHKLGTQFVQLLTAGGQIDNLFSGTVELLAKFTHGESYNDVAHVVRSFVLGCDDEAGTMALDVLTRPYLDKEYPHQYYSPTSPGVLIGLFRAVNCIERAGGTGDSSIVNTSFYRFFPQLLTKVLKTQVHSHLEHISASAEKLNFLRAHWGEKYSAELYRAAEKYAEGTESNRRERFKQVQQVRADLAKRVEEVDKEIRDVVLSSCYQQARWGDAGAIIIRAFTFGSLKGLNSDCILTLSVSGEVLFGESRG